MCVRKIGILTSGGDCPGMNATVRAVTRSAISNGVGVIGFLGGYAGILNEQFKELEWHDVARIIHKGGTIIGTGRYREFHQPEVREQAACKLKKEGLDGLVVIGGDGSLTGAYLLGQETGFPTVGIPATIDNDVYGTDLALGTDTALNLGAEVLDRLHDTAASHERVFVVEMFGNRSGYLAILCGLAAGAMEVLVPEEQIGADDLQRLAGQIGTWYNRAVRQQQQIESPRHAIVVIAEGARFTHMPEERLDRQFRKVKAVEACLKGVLEPQGGDCRSIVLGHMQRGGSPSAFDRILGTRLGAAAFETLKQGRRGVMVGLKGRSIEETDLEVVVAQTQEIQEHPEANLDQRGLRDSLKIQRDLGQVPLHWPEARKNLLVLTSGADAPGMNIGIRAVVRSAFLEGWRTWGARHGFSRLVDGGNFSDFLREEEIQEFSWADVHMGKAISTGGSFLGTTRTESIEEAQAQSFWCTIDSGEIDGVVVFGGVHALRVCCELAKSPLRKSLVFIPATISNNLPGTDMCIGADTALNNLMTVIDKTKDTGVSLQRIHVVQVMGRTCGWLAIHTALVGGAEAAFDLETGLDLDRLVDIADYLRNAFERPGAEGQRTGIVVLNERAARTFSAETIRQILTERTPCEARVVDPAQMQRGGPPSAFDRILACRLGVRAVEELDKAHGNGDPPALIVGWKDGEVQVSPLEETCEPLRTDPEGIPYEFAQADHDLLDLVSRRLDSSPPT